MTLECKLRTQPHSSHAQIVTLAIDHDHNFSVVTYGIQRYTKNRVNQHTEKKPNPSNFPIFTNSWTFTATEPGTKQNALQLIYIAA